MKKLWGKIAHEITLYTIKRISIEEAITTARYSKWAQIKKSVVNPIISWRPVKDSTTKSARAMPL